jgi:hypothetical protein
LKQAVHLEDLRHPPGAGSRRGTVDRDRTNFC